MMNRKVYSLCLLYFIAYQSVAQDTTYYAKNRQVSTLDSAIRFAVGKMDSSTQLYLVEYYNYKNKVASLDRIVYYNNNKKEKQEGIEKVYHDDGSLAAESFYKNGIKNGRYVNYFKNGSIYREMFFNNGKREGNFKMYHFNGNISRDEAYSQDKWISGKMYDSTGRVIPYCGEFEQQPEFDGGATNFYKYLNKNVKFPKHIAKSKDFKGGKVIVTFYVETDGSVGEVEILKGLHPELDEEAMRVISNMPRWKRPGYQDCKPVRVKFNVPISFLL